VTNLHPTDFAHESYIRQMWILAGSITSPPVTKLAVDGLLQLQADDITVTWLQDTAIKAEKINSVGLEDGADLSGTAC